ncbi:YciI family protein [Neobacillus drentensis]|uniref:YciI family protein n=1 Tax=Neobacillus drentensis TaxID=220684 RepID=UPI002FFE44A9
MKKFVVHLTNKQRELMTKELIMEHVAYLRKLKGAGVLTFCGPCVNGTALMIVNAPTYDKAKEYVESDPFSKVDYYIDRNILEVEEATLENNFLIDDVLTYLNQKQL